MDELPCHARKYGIRRLVRSPDASVKINKSSEATHVTSVSDATRGQAAAIPARRRRERYCDDSGRVRDIHQLDALTRRCQRDEHRRHDSTDDHGISPQHQ